MVRIHRNEHLVVGTEHGYVVVSVHPILASSKQCASPALHLHIVPEPMESLCRVVVHDPMPFVAPLDGVVPREVPCWAGSSGVGGVVPVVQCVVLVLVRHVQLQYRGVLVRNLFLVRSDILRLHNHEMWNLHLAQKPGCVASFASASGHYVYWVSGVLVPTNDPQLGIPSRNKLRIPNRNGLGRYVLVEYLFRQVQVPLVELEVHLSIWLRRVVGLVYWHLPPLVLPLRVPLGVVLLGFCLLWWLLLDLCLGVDIVFLRQASDVRAIALVEVVQCGLVSESANNPRVHVRNLLAILYIGWGVL